MFDLDQAIAEWRRRMRAAGVKTPALLDELESHLRDDVETQVSGGVEAQEAFAAAVVRLGEAGQLQSEFVGAGGLTVGREYVKDAFLTLAGIPRANLDPNMNTATFHSTTEPRWATYIRAAVSLAPAMGLWTFSAVFLFPKLEEICRRSGVRLPSVYQLALFIAHHPLLICSVPILLLVLLEWRSNGWPKYRRFFLGGTVFVLNAAVLVLITVMVVLGLVAASVVLSHTA